MREWLTQIFFLDQNLFTLIQRYVQNDLFNLIMPYITYLGNWGIIWIIIAVAIYFKGGYMGKRRAGVLLVALFLSNFFTDVIKEFIMRPRPNNTFENLRLLIATPTGYSFPSGHTATAFASARVIAQYYRYWSMPVYLFAALMGFSRIYVGAHFPIDVFVGIIIGLLTAALVFWIRNRLL